MDYTAWGSLPAMLFDRAQQKPDYPLLYAKREGAWQPMSRAQMATRVRDLAKALIRRGIQPGQRIVLIAENRPEWAIAHFAIMSCGAVTVPAYTTNTSRDHLHILTNSGAVGALLSSRELAGSFLPAAAEAPECGFVLALEPATAEGVAIHDWAEEEAAGAAEADDELERRLEGLKRDEACIFIYTSGTGGVPKGVMLSHTNILTNCASAFDLLQDFRLEGAHHTFLSFLPLSHSYEHAAGLCFPISIDADIHYAESVEKLSANLVEVRPTLMTAVPRLYESLHQRIVGGLKRQSAFRQTLFHRTVALGTKRHAGQRLTLAERLQDRILDRIVRDKVRQRFGGRLLALISGGAALNPEIGRFFQALGLTLLQGYGQTESAPVVSCNKPSKVKMASVGPALAGVEVRIAEDGEILVRGDNVMLGYWQDPEGTARALRDGWLHTGDVGHMDDEGYIYITDRKKDLIVLSGGDNVSPARLEGLLTMEPEIEQAYVVGDRRAYLVALLVPSRGLVDEWASASGKPPELDRLAEDPAFCDRVGEAVDRANAKASVLERIRRFLVAPEAFSIENGMMTPTMKIRRHKIHEAYGARLEALYQRKGS